jgi:hypothetical protein
MAVFVAISDLLVDLNSPVMGAAAGRPRRRPLAARLLDLSPTEAPWRVRQSLATCSTLPVGEPNTFSSS